MKIPRIMLPVVVMVAAIASRSSAAVIVDGVLDPDYGATLSIQATQSNVPDATSAVDFSAIPGDQFFSICPPPTPARATTWGHVKVMYR